MKLPITPPLSEANFFTSAFKYLRDVARMVNALIEGRVYATEQYTAAPTTGEWFKGDFVRNANPAEAGAAGSKYVVIGFICVTSGTPGTWKECRCLTGA